MGVFVEWHSKAGHFMSSLHGSDRLLEFDSIENEVNVLWGGRRIFEDHSKLSNQ